MSRGREGKEREGRIIEDHKQDRTGLSPIIESALEFPSGSEEDEGLEGTDGTNASIRSWWRISLSLTSHSSCSSPRGIKVTGRKRMKLNDNRGKEKKREEETNKGDGE